MLTAAGANLEHESSSILEDDVRAARAISVPNLVAVGIVIATSLALAGCGSNGSDSATSTPPVAPTAAAPSPANSPAATPHPPAATASAPIAPSGPITITSPAANATVGRTFTVKGRSRTFEGALVWQLNQAENTVRFGTAKGGSTSVAPFAFTVQAPAAGDYTIVVLEESAKDGAPLNQTQLRVTVA
jgi:hypothetical protein